MSFGVNVDPLNPAGAPDPAELVATNVRWLRLVCRHGVEDYVSRAQAAGLMVMAVVTDQSEGYVYGGPDVHQFGNEPDGPGGVPAAEYQQQATFYQRTYPQLNWIAAGLVSGQPDYWQAIQAAGGLPGFSGFDVHPYAKTASETHQLLSAYAAITPDLPVWVTEWNRPAAEVPAFAAMLKRDTVGHAWFCFSDAMVAGFGLDPGRQRLLGALEGAGFPFV